MIDFNNVAPYNGLRFANQLKTKYPGHQIARSAPILGRLRAVKSKYEIDMMREACDITAKAHQRVLKFLKPGVTEYEIEAEITHEFNTESFYGSCIYSNYREWCKCLCASLY